MSQKLLTAACAAAFAAAGFSAAVAAPAAPVANGATVPSATASIDYTYNDYNHLGALNEYGGALDGVVPIGSSNSWSAQIDGSYHDLSGPGGSISLYDVDGAVAWHSAVGRVGASVGYTGSSIGGSSVSFVSYGVYGEWFANQNFTAGVRGGGVSVASGGGGTSVGYAGAMLRGYATPDLAINGQVDSYFDNGGSEITTAGVSAEWLISRKTPLSITAGYTYSDVGSLIGNDFTVGLKYYFGGQGAPLVERQRDGVDDWGPIANGLRYAY